MKKKLIVSILICFLSASGIFAISMYIAPMDGTYGIPMDSPVFNLNTKAQNVTWIRASAQQLWNALKSGGEFDDHEGHVFTGDNAYADFTMVGLAGAKEITSGAKHVLKATFTSPAGLNFISLSNPNIVRPYRLAVIGRRSNQAGTSENAGTQELTINGGTLSIDIPSGYDAAWFDLVLILPYDSIPDNSLPSTTDKEDVLVSNGVRYKLVESDDYSSVIYLNLELVEIAAEGSEKVVMTKTMPIPLSGFYKPSDKDSTLTENKSMFGMNVIPTAYCSNLDLNRQQGSYVKIASLNLISNDSYIVDGSLRLPTDRPNAGLVPPKAVPEPDWPIAVGGDFKGKPIKKAPSKDNYWMWSSGGKKNYETDTAAWKNFYRDNTAAVDRYNAYLSEKNDYDRQIAFNNADLPNRLFMFLSSSPDPFVKGDRFQMVHDQTPPNEIPNNRMSINYKLVVVDNDFPQYTREYDGTKFVGINDNLMDDNDLFVTYSRREEHTHSTKRYYHNLNADVYIILEPKTIDMVSGRYEDRIYIHVMGQN